MQRPIVFMDLDETLVKTRVDSKQDAVKQLAKEIERRKERMARRGGKEMVSGTLEAMEAELDWLEDYGVNLVIHGEVFGVVVPRPFMASFLRKLDSFADVYLLSSGSQEYIDAVTSTLDIRDDLKAVISSREPILGKVTVDRWILVDDLGFDTAGVQEKLQLLGDVDPKRHYKIEPFFGRPDKVLNDNLVQIIADRLGI